MAVIHKEDSIKELKKKNVFDTVNQLGQELAQEKLKGIQKDIIIDSLGQQLTLMKLDIMALKGGE